MTDGIIKNTGDSRRIKSVGLPDTYAELKALWEDSGILIDLLLNPEGWHQLGTLLNRAGLLSAQTEVALWGDDADRTVDAALRLQKTSVHYTAGAKAVDILGNPIGGLAMEKVYEMVTAADAPQINVSLQGIDLSKYSRLEMQMRLLNAGTSPVNVFLRINGLTSGYRSQHVSASSPSSTAYLGVVASAPLNSNSAASAMCRLHLTPGHGNSQAGILAEILGAGGVGNDASIDWYSGFMKIGSLGNIQTFNIVPQIPTTTLIAGSEIIVYGVLR